MKYSRMWKEERTMERDLWIRTINYSFPYEFYKSYLMIKTKIIIPSDIQVNDI